jgi:hypothetical protein
MSELIQVDIDQRPVSINLVTKMMEPDGIFIRTINSGMAIMRVNLPNPWHSSGGPFPDVFLFDNADSNEIIIQNLGPFENGYIWWQIPRGQSSFSWYFLVNLTGASVGKHSVKIRMRRFYGLDPWFGTGQDIEYTGQVFVSDALFDSQTLKGNVVVPEGDYSLSITGVRVFQDEPIKGKIPCNNKSLFLPKDFETRIDFTSPFTGSFGPIPFNDPWWKAAGWIVAAIAGTIAGGWALGGWLGWWDSPIEHIESGSVDPVTGEVCRECQPAPAGQGFTTVQGDPIWGAFLTAAAGGVAVGLADIIDPYRRGEDASPPNSLDRTKAESLKFSLDYIQFPLPGTPYKIGVKWEFQRHGIETENYDPISSHDELQNIHYITNYDVRTSDGMTEYDRASTREVYIVVDVSQSPDFARYKKELSEGVRRMIPEFYVLGYMRHRSTGLTKSSVFALQNNLHIGAFAVSSSDPLGEWDVMAIVQNVNNADRRGTPVEQAQVIGGFVYSNNFNLQHNNTTGTCVVSPNWDLTVRLA